MAGEFGGNNVSIEAERGQLIAGRKVSTGANQWQRLATEVTGIEGVVVKALATNTGEVNVNGAGGVAEGYPLAAGDTVSIGINDLSKVYVFIAVSGEGVAYLAITDTKD